MSRALATLFVCFALLLSGCADNLPTVQTFEPIPDQATCRVVILPFADRSDYPQATGIVSSILYAQLVSGAGFSVLPAGDISSLYKQLKMYPGQRPTRDQLRIIGTRLNAGLFISGDILSMEEDLDSHPPRTRLSLIMRLYDGKSGTMFWATYHRRRGEDYRQILHFGRINTVTALARRMIDEIIQLWRTKGLQPCAS